MVEKPEESERSILTHKSQTLGPPHQKKKSSKNKSEKPYIPLHKLSKMLYRVAQNKIPHQTICNIFATSGQILKILEAI